MTYHYFRTIRRLATLFVLLLLATAPRIGVRAQIVDPRGGEYPDYGGEELERERGPTEQRTVQPDTFGIFLYTVENPNRERAFADSLLDGFQRYELDRRPAFDYATLGQLGSAAHPLRYTPLHRTGLEVGLRQYELYRLDGRNLDYYRLERPFTYVEYLRGSAQADAQLLTKFSRNFSDGVNLVLQFDRLSQQGTQEQYPSSELRNTNLAVATGIRPPGSRYSGYFSYVAATFEQFQNGGIINPFPDENGGEINNNGNLDPFLSATDLRYAYRQAMATQYLQFGGTVDTLTGVERRAFTVRHQLRYDERNYRMASVASTADTSFYNLYPDFLLDGRGVRSRIGHRIVANEVDISTFRRGASGNQETVQRDVVELGLTHQLHLLEREPGDSTVNFLIARGRVGLRPSDRLNVEVNGQLNLFGQIGDYRVAATGELDLGRFGKIELEALNQLYAPDLVQQRYQLNGVRFYDNNFGKTLEFRVGGSYTIPVLGIRAGASYGLLTDYVYYNAEGFPQQAGGVANILQLTAERDFDFGQWRLTNRVLLQEADQAVFRLPQLFGEHSIYYAGKWFGVLNVNAGIDARYTAGYRPYYYNPLLQQFQLQDAQDTKFQVQVDPFLGIRVTRFRFFVKFIQVNTLWNSEKLFYLAARNPYPDIGFRFGLSWRLLD